ncbi:hypothetical protein [Chryseobacterium polytrichastri]|uniref:Uncharacterized protein n=1 Tax=Chryseobacterium polytrichastri TaxID=1302687 RepID=A0A1M7FE01_9FLAO|nr:hypothetical protein [Chryseobacterium polytrichastri]SHM01897.1 hypothetical protein SAMN05444267_103148 [Chryseobacterium polytrichastri]
MEKIKNILLENPSMTDLIDCLDLVRKNGDIVVVKFDGEREQDFYTLFITFSLTKNKSMIRIDHSNLRDAILELLKRYINS